MRSDGSDRRVLTVSLDRNCVPYPFAPRACLGRRPRRASRSRTAATSTSTRSPRTVPGEPELLVGGEQSIGHHDLVDGTLVYTASTHTPAPRALCRTRQAAHVGLRRLRRRAAARRRGAVHAPLRPTAPRSTRGSCVRPTSTRAGAIRSSSRSTAARSRSTEPGSSTRSRSMPAPGTASSSRTRAAAPATPRSGDARFAVPATAPGRAGARSTTRI